ncbi:SAM-dependent methyltransferase [Solilutibacter tolerans]|uniref:Cyclopropane-fatty-acyl-phospholipid synthase n=1 Tax=Solilutibacter tolerans TaxID=1604334 RepID=A0A1N6QLU3_9GAMM|nr:cyclopropane-fatty-acyl-phospholipid synthase family protein [Lysobacter tolerans]SIQ17537.1 cyclopropane-fatty-acyl-phospholipid synthase [Lysobacter tolerans]
MNASIDSLSSTRARFGAWDRFLRTRLLASVGQLRGGRLEIHDPLGQVTAGDERSDTIIRLHINDAGFYHAVATRGSVGAGESYMDGAWRCDDLVGLIRLLVRNRDLLDRMETGMARFGGMAMRGVHALRANTRAGARRNIAAHYDLGNDFFRLFLSEDMMYSSALWAHDADTLEAASERKLARIAEKLQLGPADHVIEIGTGWGGFALHAAGRYGCRVTTTTISREQYELAKARIAEAGLQDRVDVLLSDYRDLRGQYDKLVSIEMIEAIGHAQQREYFGQIGKLLKPDGRALIQAITIEDHRYQQALNSVDFIKRHVFPGCFIPSISSMLEEKTKSTDLALVHLEDFGSSYAKTLQAWRERFLSRLDEVRAQGYDERLIRMWEFYLAYCEGGFRERSIGVAHLLFAKPDCRDADYLPGLHRLEA